jgi:ferredoxin
MSEKKIGLTPDQFQFDGDGNVVINHDEISEAIRYQEATETPPEEAIKISIDVS